MNVDFLYMLCYNENGVRQKMFEVNRKIIYKSSFAIPFNYRSGEKIFPVTPMGIGVMDCRDDYYFKRKQELGYSLIYILEGKAELLYDGIKFEMRRDEMVLVSQSHYHELHIPDKKPMKYSFINMATTQFTDELYDMLYSGGFKPVMCTIPSEMELKFNKLKKLAKGDDSTKELMVFSLISSLLADLYRDVKIYERNLKEKNIPEWCLKAVRFFEEHYDEKININTLAESNRKSLSLFSKEFKKNIGYSPTAFLREVRLKNATNMLLYSSKSLDAIACDAGFSSTSRFIEAFGKQNGITPYKFRKQKNEFI